MNDRDVRQMVVQMEREEQLNLGRWAAAYTAHLSGLRHFFWCRFVGCPWGFE